MNNLIKVTVNENQEPVVSARELYKALEVKKRFSAWFEQNAKLFQEGYDFMGVPEGTPIRNGNGRIQYLDDYALTLETAKHLALMSRTDKGHEVRQYFIEVEKEWNSPEKIMARAIKLADKKIISLKAQIERDRPKTLFADAVEASHNSILIGELAKILKQNGLEIGQNRLFALLRNEGYLISRKGASYNMPTQKSMNLGLFEIKETAITHADGHVTINKTPKVTGKGQLYFINRFLGRESLQA